MTLTAPLLATTEETLRLVRSSRVLGIDLETTGLSAVRDRIRLVSLSNGRDTIVYDVFENPLAPVLDALKDRILIAHNAAFDLGFLFRAGLHDLPETICTYLIAQMLTAGEGSRGFGHCGLASCVKRWLGKTLPKELRTSDWSGPLSDDQVAYAARDAEVLIPLLRRMDDELTKAELHRAADIEMRAVRAFVWMTQSGVPFDQTAWLALADRAAERKKELGEWLDRAAPIKGDPGLFGAVESWNWDSPQQVVKVFGLLGIPINTSQDVMLALLSHPFAKVMRVHRHQSQLVKMYGHNWLDKATLVSGRVYPGWRQLGAASGRTACEGPNCQQIPQDEEGGKAVYRACIRAPEGRVLVKCDYSTLQMRIACNRARDKALYDVFAAGGDPHTATAQALLGKQDVTKADRQIAKSANFALLFGAGSEGLRIYAKTTYGIDLSEDEAKAHRASFFRRYSGLARWHDETRWLKVPETRTVAGRRRLLPGHAPDTWRLNSPVQGDEADGLKLALALLWERRNRCPGVRPVLAVHDEIVLEVDEAEAGPARLWLEEAMLDGMRPVLDPVPCKVESRIYRTWGG